jgi:hypothetical protein
MVLHKVYGAEVDIEIQLMPWKPQRLDATMDGSNLPMKTPRIMKENQSIIPGTLEDLSIRLGRSLYSRQLRNLDNEGKRNKQPSAHPKIRYSKQTSESATVLFAFASENQTRAIHGKLHAQHVKITLVSTHNNNL